MTRVTRHIIWPVLLWAVHFIAIYALISAACAPRMLLDVDTIRASAAVLTVLFAIALIIGVIRIGQLRRRYDPGTSEAPLAQAAWWCVQISLLAVLANTWPLAMMTSCSG